LSAPIVRPSKLTGTEYVPSELETGLSAYAVSPPPVRTANRLINIHTTAMTAIVAFLTFVMLITYCTENSNKCYVSVDRILRYIFYQQIFFALHNIFAIYHHIPTDETIIFRIVQSYCPRQCNVFAFISCCRLEKCCRICPINRITYSKNTTNLCNNSYRRIFICYI